MSDLTDKSGELNVVKIDIEDPSGSSSDPSPEPSREEISVILWQSGDAAEEPDVCESCQTTQSVLTSKEDSGHNVRGDLDIPLAPVFVDRKATKSHDATGPYTDYITQKRLPFTGSDDKVLSSGIKTDMLQVKGHESETSQSQVDDAAKPVAPYKAVASKRKLFHAKKRSLLSPTMKKKKLQSADVGPMHEQKRKRSLTSNLTTEGFTIHENASLTGSDHSQMFAHKSMSVTMTVPVGTGSDIDQAVNSPNPSENGMGTGLKSPKASMSYGSDSLIIGAPRSKISRTRLSAPKIRPNYGTSRTRIDVRNRKTSFISRSRSNGRKQPESSETSLMGKERQPVVGKKQTKSATSGYGLKKLTIGSKRTRHQMKIRVVEPVETSSKSLGRTSDISRWLARKPSLRKDAFLQRYDPDEKFQTKPLVRGRRGGEELAKVPYSFVIAPEGNFMYVWLMLVTLSIVYNLWTIIAREAFDDILRGYELRWFIADGVADIIYIVDIFVQMRTGYLEMGMLVGDTRLLLAHYIKSRMFIWDLVSMTPLDLIQFYIGVHPIVRFPRFVKVYRTFKFMYIIGMKAIYPNLWRVVNLVHLLLLGSHWFASFYFIVSKLENYEGAWSYPLPVNEHAHVLRKYLKSLHWATMTLTNIGDKNLPESTYE